jgi:hypothetical protein
MSHIILGVVLFLISVTGGQGAVVPIRGQEGYFFPPPPALSYFRPDLYIYRVTGLRNGPGIAAMRHLEGFLNRGAQTRFPSPV